MSDAGTLYQNYLSKSNFARIRTLDSSAWSDQVSWDAVGSSQALNPQRNKREPFFATASCATLTCLLVAGRAWKSREGRQATVPFPGEVGAVA
jgi:hypothetical protein